MFAELQKPKTVIGYGPFIPQSPTKPDIVETSLEYCMAAAIKLGQQNCIVTCDQAGLKKKKEQKYQYLIPRMGGFHIANNYLGVIGTLFKSSGIETILSEAGICQLGTVNKSIAGHDYYGMVRCHTLLLSAMLDLYWEAFDAWSLSYNEEQLDAVTS